MLHEQGQPYAGYTGLQGLIAAQDDGPDAMRAGAFDRDNAAVAARCSMGQRFDRKHVLAYEWNGGRERLGLAMSINGPALDDPARFEITKAVVQFKMRFDPPGYAQKRACRYESAWQGLIGSGYNEFFLREDNTVWDELRYLRSDAEDRFGSILP